MGFSAFKRDFERLRGAVSSVRSKNLDLSGEVEFDKSIYNFVKRRQDSYRNEIKNSLSALKLSVYSLNELIGHDKGNALMVPKIIKAVVGLDGIELNKVESRLDVISRLLDELNVSEVKGVGFVKPRNVPVEIKGEVLVDLREMERCFNAGCYRSAVIICGRVLETALHRKYYEISGRDILEKQPGIGLGKLVAKLVEREVKFDPGVTQQIHLINQVRVFSVHKKKEPFYPTREQAHAMVLYTLDVLKKLF